MSAELDALAERVRLLPGVASVVLQAGDDGSFDVAHLQLAPGADKVATSLAALSLLREHLRLPVPPDAVRLREATPPEPSPAPLPRQSGSRPTILRNQTSTTDLETTVTVVLSCAGKVAAGDAVGPATTAAARRTAAEATLRAVERLVGGRGRFDVQSVELLGQGAEASVLVALALVTSAGVERLTGAACVKEDESRAVIRATLDGLNRRLETLLV